MIRRQIRLTEQQDAALRRAAAARKMSAAALVRQAIERELHPDAEEARLKRALSFVGRSPETAITSLSSTISTWKRSAPTTFAFDEDFQAQGFEAVP